MVWKICNFYPFHHKVIHRSNHVKTHSEDIVDISTSFLRFRNHFDTAADILTILFVSLNVVWHLHPKSRSHLKSWLGKNPPSLNFLPPGKAHASLGSTTCTTDHVTSCLVDCHNDDESDFYWTWSSDFNWHNCTSHVCQTPTEQQTISSISVIDSTPQHCFLLTFLCPVAGTIFS